MRSDFGVTGGEDDNLHLAKGGRGGVFDVKREAPRTPNFRD